MIGKKIRALWGVCMVGLTVLGGCFNGLEAPEAGAGAKDGAVTILIGEEGRTLMPDVRQFESLELTITPAAGGEAVYQEAIVGGQATVYLGQGAWNLRVDGYVGNDLRATATNTLTNSGGEITGNTRFSLAPVGTGTGRLKYKITKPAGSTLGTGSVLVLSRADGGALSLGESFTGGVLSLSDSVDATVVLDPGRYKAEVLLKGPEGTYAATVETVVILPGLETALRFEPASYGDPAFLAPLSFGTTLYNSSSTRIGASGGTASARTQGIFADGPQDEVYFTLAKTGAQSVSIKNQETFVRKATGAVDGTPPGNELEVYTVDTSSIRLGGYREFTLEVTETGKSPITIAVTVSHGSFGLFIDNGDAGTGESLERVESDDEAYPIVDLKTALAYLSAFGTSNATYVIYLDEDQAIPPWMGFSASQQNITLRLRGIGEHRTVSWDPNEPYVYNEYRGGLFNMLNQISTTLELDRIILDGKNVPIGVNLSFVYMAGNCTLVLKEGTKITNFVSLEVPSSTVLGAAIAGLQASQGTVIMEGGEISGNRPGQALIAVGTFEMHGGSIRNNNSEYLGASPIVANSPSYAATSRAVAVHAKNFTMNGGEIRDNGLHSVMSGVAVTTSGTMNGGTIENNGKYKDLMGGGIIIGQGATFTLQGGTIKNNSSSETPGNGIWIINIATGSKGQLILRGTFTLEDRIGTISGTAFTTNTTQMGRRGIVTVGYDSYFTNTVGDTVTLDLHGNGNRADAETYITGKSFITVTDLPSNTSVSEALDYFTFGYFSAGRLEDLDGVHLISPASLIKGRVSDFFTVDLKTGVLTYQAPEV